VLCAIGLFCISGCSVRHADAVYGKSVQQKIDDTIAPLIASYYPKLKIEPSRCEPIIEIAQGTMGTCTLPVNEVPLNIRVASAGPPDMFKVDFGGAFFFDMSAVERIIETTLSNSYQIKGIAQCGNPRERLLKPRTYFSCKVLGSSLVRSMRLMTTVTGQVFVFNVPGLKVKSPIPGSLLTLHKDGRTAIAPGAGVERFIQQVQMSASSASANFTIKCPEEMDLTGTKHGACTATLPGLKIAQRIGVWIDDAVGFRVRPIDAVVDRSKVQRMAQDDLNRRLSDNGDTADARVECDKGLIVVEPPGTFDCKARAGGKRYKLVVEVENFQGAVRWRGIPLDGRP